MQSDVKEFMIAAHQTVYINNHDQSKLYETLIAEELDELTESIEKNDAIESLDACMDLIWVIIGYCYSRGFNVDEAWAEVARSNLSKIDEGTKRVLKREDGKVIKPEGWTPPDLSNCVLQKTLDNAH